MQGALARVCAMAICVSASLGQRDLIESPHWAAPLSNFPSLALLTMALKVEMRWCPQSGFLDSLLAVPASWEGFVQKMNQHREDVLHPLSSWSLLLGNYAFILPSCNAQYKWPKCKPIPACSAVLQGTDNTKPKSLKYQTTEMSTTD